MAAPSRYLHAFTISPDELEILYVIMVIEGVRIHRSVRDSVGAVFPPGQHVTDLDAAFERCPSHQIYGIDLSGDGLTLYMGCYGDFAMGPLMVARRSRIGASFTLDTPEYGTVGRWLSVSRDELTVYSDGELLGTGAEPRPLMFTRSSTAMGFGSGVLIPGIDYVLNTPEPSPDGLRLFAAIGAGLHEIRRDRVDAPFGTPRMIVRADFALGAWDPEISRDCRRLYYMNRIDSNPGVQDPVTSIRVVER